MLLAPSSLTVAPVAVRLPNAAAVMSSGDEARVRVLVTVKLLPVRSSAPPSTFNLATDMALSSVSVPLRSLTSAEAPRVRVELVMLRLELTKRLVRTVILAPEATERPLVETSPTSRVPVLDTVIRPVPRVSTMPAPETVSDPVPLTLTAAPFPTERNRPVSKLVAVSMFRVPPVMRTSRAAAPAASTFTVWVSMVTSFWLVGTSLRSHVEAVPHVAVAALTSLVTGATGRMPRPTEPPVTLL